MSFPSCRSNGWVHNGLKWSQGGPPKGSHRIRRPSSVGLLTIGTHSHSVGSDQKRRWHRIWRNLQTQMVLHWLFMVLPDEMESFRASICAPQLRLGCASRVACTVYETFFFSFCFFFVADIWGMFSQQRVSMVYCLKYNLLVIEYLWGGGNRRMMMAFLSLINTYVGKRQVSL